MILPRCSSHDPKFILNGLHLDKEVQQKVIQLMATDNDTKRLIRIAKRQIWLQLSVLIFVLLSTIAGIILRTYDISSKILTTAGMSALVFIVLFHLSQYLTAFRGLLKGYFEFFKYCKFILSGRSPKRPLDLWSMFVAGLSDSHTLIPASILFKDHVKFIYCGQPYYKIEFIDSILISGVKGLRKEYNKFFKTFSTKTFIHEFEKRPPFALNERQLTQSKYVFGIFFLSKFFYHLLCNKDKTVGKNKSFYFDFSEKLISDNEKKEFAEECIRLASDPANTFFNKLSIQEHGIKIRVENIFTLKDKIEGKIPKRRKNEILIPFKRFIALPLKYEQKEDKTEKVTIDRSLILPSLIDIKRDCKIFIMGGAEHNLGLLHIINLHREIKNNNRSFGIAENAFDQPEYTKSMKCNIAFKIGASHFVYGINKVVRNRIIENINADNSNEAEVFKLTINQYILFLRI